MADSLWLMARFTQSSGFTPWVKRAISYRPLAIGQTIKRFNNQQFNNNKMISYKELGLVNTRKMFAKAVDGGYAIPAFNFNNMEQLQAIIMASPFSVKLSMAKRVSGSV